MADKEGKKKRGPRTNLNISAEEFVRIWQASPTVEAVAETIAKKSGVMADVTTLRQRARWYRNEHGVSMKEMPRNGGGARQDWKALNDLAKSLNKKAA